jgi:hypothetical protein
MAIIPIKPELMSQTAGGTGTAVLLTLNVAVYAKTIVSPAGTDAAEPLGPSVKASRGQKASFLLSKVVDDVKRLTPLDGRNISSWANPKYETVRNSKKSSCYKIGYHWTALYR